MKQKIILLILLIGFSSYGFTQTNKGKKKDYIDFNKNNKKDIYEDKSQTTAKRVEDLLYQMTFKEKQGQLLMDLGWNMYERKNDKIILTEDFKKTMKEKSLGALWGFFRADPWSQKVEKTAINPLLARQGVNLLQKYMIDSTRLGIPMFIAEECMHGIMEVGAKTFPTGLLQAATFNDSLVFFMAKEINYEAKRQGINVCFGPLLDLAREPRWSRVEETYGEDTYLTSVMGKAFVKGLVNDDKDKERHLLPTLKHFAAYGISEGGHNGASAHIGVRELNSELLPPFFAAINSGAALVMTSYNEIDGTPCTMNPYLLKHILRDKWNFNGIVISDLHSISGLTSHTTAKDLKQAAEKSIMAGVDMDLSATDFFNNLSNVDTNRLNEAVRRVLTKKFECGLFDNPYITQEWQEDKENDSLTYDVAKEGIVLLENKADFLPINKEKSQRIAVIGPNANSVYNLLGDYTAPQPQGKVTTIYNGMKTYENKDIKVSYSYGCGIKDTSNAGFSDAIQKAKESDFVVFCLGGSSSRYENIEYQQTGAAKVDNNTVSDISCGEGFDRNSLTLLGNQEKLYHEIKKLNKPIILVLVNGRPLIINKEMKESNAVLECFYPGEEGGKAVADIIFGTVNPSGKLPISIPRTVGQLPIYYNSKIVANRSPYLEDSCKALYPFGYGLSYTRFSYKDMKVEIKNNGTDSCYAVVNVTINNVGQKSGKDVTQIYIKKDVNDFTQPSLTLCSFKKTLLEKGEEKQISLLIPSSFFHTFDYNGENQYLNKGSYQIMLGKDSQNIILSTEVTIR
jgi:beta-glucosidase